MTNKRKFVIFWLIFIVTTILALFIGVFVGKSISSPKGEIVISLLRLTEGSEPILILRLTRVFAALACGAALSLAGYLMQLVVQNPLADPYLLGTASAASFGSSLVYAGIIPTYFAGLYLPPILAFGFGAMVNLVVVTVAFRLSGRGTGYNMGMLLLTGVGISMLFSAALSGITFVTEATGKMRGISYWANGNFDRAEYDSVIIVACATFIVILISTALHNRFLGIIMGYGLAKNLGINIKLMIGLLVILSALLTSLAVSVAGIIGFIGLIVPHFSRGYFGVTKRRVYIITALLGAGVLLIADSVARLCFGVAGMPTGIVCTFIGAPFFLYLLSERKFV